MQSRKEGSQGQVTSPHTPQCPWGNQRTLFPQSERVWSKAALCSGEGAPGWVVKGWVVEVFISLGSCQDRGPGLVLFQWLAGLHWGPRQSRRLHQLREACSLLPGGKAGEEAGTLEMWLCAEAAVTCLWAEIFWVDPACPRWELFSMKDQYHRSNCSLCPDMGVSENRLSLKS